jgi:hypothetical protein
MSASACRLPLLLAALLASAPAAQAGDLLPDLSTDRETLERSVSLDLLAFQPGHCVLLPADLCVGGPGSRKLLRFSVLAVNHGPGELIVGAPAQNPERFEFSECHGHYHFESFARYELRALDGSLVATGHKQSFCVEDTERVADDAAIEPKYSCNLGSANADAVQGVQVGWGDLYPSTLDCQWVDVTDVAPGDYQLHVFLNSAQLLPEASYLNNEIAVAVSIPGPTDTTPVPKVTVRSPNARKKAGVGGRLRIKWRGKVPKHGKIRFQDVAYSTDDGVTWQLIEGGLGPKVKKLDWTVPAEAASETARVRVTVWSQDLQRADATSATFRIEP